MINRFSQNRHRKDGNHKEIAQRLEELGCSVLDCSQLGMDVPDLLVGLLGRDYLIEVKMPGKGPTPDQIDWHNAWRGQKPTIMWTCDQATAWVKAMRERLLNDGWLA